MMYYPKMIGEKVFLSAIDPSASHDYTKWVNDIEVSVGVGLAPKIISETSEREILERLRDSGENFAIIAKDTGKAIGNCGFPKLNLIDKAAEVGIFIGNKEYWNGGYGTEALSLLCDFAFNVLNIHNISLKVYAFNLQAIHCYQKIGFQEVGRIREAKMIAGQKYDEVIMDLLDHEFVSPYIKGIIDKKKQLK